MWGVTQAAVYCLLFGILVFLYRVVWKPLRLMFFYRSQGVSGSPFRPLVGDLLVLANARHRTDEAFHLVFREMKASHGEVLTTFLGPELRLRIHDLDALKTILADNTGVYEKPSIMKRVLGRVLGDGLVTTDGALHRKHRKMLTPAFAWWRLRSMTPLMVRAGDAAIDRWLAAAAAPGKGSSFEMDFHHEISGVTLAIIANAAFGAEMDGSTSDVVYTAVSDLLNQAIAHVLSGAAFFIPGHRHLPFPSTLRANRNIRELKSLLGGIMAKRREARAAAAKAKAIAGPAGESRAGASDGGHKAAAAGAQGCSQELQDAELLVDYLLDAREALEASSASSAATTVAAAAEDGVPDGSMASAAAGAVAGSSASAAARPAQAAAQGEGFTDAQLMDHALTFALAGHETTAQALTWTLLLLHRNPEWKRRVRGAVLSVCGRDRMPSYDDVKDPRMAPLEWALQESMRMYPPVPFIVRTCAADREVALSRPLSGPLAAKVSSASASASPATSTATAGAEGEDASGAAATVPRLRIAAGTSVFIPIAGIHRDPDNYERPDEFDPLRFQHGIGRASKHGHPLAYLPFSAGPRNCIGSNFATLEARMILARLLQRLDFAVLPSYVHKPMPTITLVSRRCLASHCAACWHCGVISLRRLCAEEAATKPYVVPASCLAISVSIIPCSHLFPPSPRAAAFAFLLQRPAEGMPVRVWALSDEEAAASLAAAAALTSELAAAEAAGTAGASAGLTQRR